MDYATEITKRLERVCPAVRTDQIFEDFVETALSTVTMQPSHDACMAVFGRMAEDPAEISALWENLRERYDEKDFLLFAEAIGLLIAGAQAAASDLEENRDIIGAIYMNFGRPIKGRGQYFTPWEIALAMAKLTTSDGAAVVRNRIKEATRKIFSDDEPAKLELAGEILLRQGMDFDRDVTDWPESDRLFFFEKVLPWISAVIEPITIYDSSCGSGVMLMAAAAQFPGWTHDAGLVRVYGQDSDLLCTKMAKLNVLLYGLNGSRNRYIYEVARLTGADMESSQRCVRRAADPLPGASADVQMTLF